MKRVNLLFTPQCLITTSELRPPKAIYSVQHPTRVALSCWLFAQVTMTTAEVKQQEPFWMDYNYELVRLNLDLENKQMGHSWTKLLTNDFVNFSFGFTAPNFIWFSNAFRS